LESHPHEKGIVRAETPIGGWVLKKINENLTKATFCAEIDFKIALFI
jgi:hypothetical protein